MTKIRPDASSIIETIQNDNAEMDIAVFYRTNSQSRVLEQMFVEKGIRYKLPGRQIL